MACMLVLVVVVAVAIDVDGARAPAAAAPAVAAGVRGGGVEAVEGACAGDCGAPACAGIEVLAETGTDVVLRGGLVRGQPLLRRVSDVDSKRRMNSEPCAGVPLPLSGVWQDQG